MNEKLEAALSYASRGWYVFPVKAKQKIPATRHGHNDATVDPGRIIKCWGEHPDLNIGVALGASSLVAVDVDVDAYKPDCKFDKFMRGIEMPTTLVQNSANGGIHYIFKCNSDDEFAGQLCTGVDIKSNGYILLEPSALDGKIHMGYRRSTSECAALATPKRTAHEKPDRQSARHFKRGWLSRSAA